MSAREDYYAYVELDRLRAERNRLRAEVKLMRPVIEFVTELHRAHVLLADHMTGKEDMRWAFVVATGAATRQHEVVSAYIAAVAALDAGEPQT